MIFAQPKLFALLVCAVLFSQLFQGCGADSKGAADQGYSAEKLLGGKHQNALGNEVVAANPIFAMADAVQTPVAVTASQNLSGVALAAGGCGSSVTPANIPPQGSSISVITISFCVNLTVPNDAFVYDKTKWAVWFGARETDIYTADKVTVTDDGGLDAGASPRKGKVTIAINFPEGRLPDALYASLETVGSRKRLSVTPFLSGDGKGPADTNSQKIVSLQPIYMQDDAGAIKAPPVFNGVKPSDGAFVVQFSPPSKLESEDLAEGKTNAGDSSLSGYLVMYWNHDECQANSAGWDFDINPAYNKTQRDVDKANYKVSRQLDNCVYPGEPKSNDTGVCNFGCSKTADATLYGRTAENVLQPRVVPSAKGADGKQRYGCYTVVKVGADQKSYGVGDAENGSVYGVAVFALDSSSRVGYSRSSCGRVVPRDIPLASSEKGAVVKASDCFVVTAASGNRSSAAVHYWRLIRDQMILRTNAGRQFVGWYGVHGPGLATWLNRHPHYKGLLEGIFEASGKAIFSTYQVVEKVGANIYTWWQSFFGSRAWQQLNPIGLLVSGNAYAQDTAAQDTAAQDTAAQATAAQDTAAQATAAQDTAAADSARKYENPSVASSAQFYLLGGVTFPSDDSDLYKGYYPNKKPLTLIAGQSFRVLDLEEMGQLGVGGEVAYNSAKGAVPARTVRTNSEIAPEIVGSEIGFFAVGLRLTSTYSYPIANFPYLVPRATVYLGTQLTREQAPNPQDPNTTSAEETEIKARAADGWGLTYGLRASVDVSLIAMLGSERGAVMYSYGLQDFAFRFTAGYAKDTNKKMIRLSGLNMLGGFVLAFL